jgi:hypothetical protein
MKTTKMSLATIQGKLSRAEMKKIMAGSGSYGDKCGASCKPLSNNCPSTCTCENKTSSGNLWTCGGY